MIQAARILLIGVCVAIVAVATALFLMPDSTRIDDAIVILVSTFLVVLVIAIVVQHLLCRRKT
jgi:putative effector of murein hydrolase LrgA (UPF0299 family)